MTNEVDFPRGKPSFKKSKTSTSKTRKDNAPITAIFKKSQVKKKTGKKSKKVRSKSHGEEKSKILIEPVTIKNFATDTVILATVVKISDYEIDLVTCGGILVTAPIFNISKAYSSAVENFMESQSSPPNKPQSMFFPGQTLPVKYLETQKCKDSGKFDKFIVSLNPSDLYQDVVIDGLKPFASQIILSAAVDSVEDHGYLMDVGVSGIKGFLPHSEASDVVKKLGLKRLPVGSVCLCAGVSLDARVLKLSASDKKMAKSLITGNDAILPLPMLLPGTRVEARIMEITDKGLELILGNEHTGYVYRDYLKSEWDLARVNYKIADVIPVTVLFVHPISRLVSCSLRPVPSVELYEKLRMKSGDKIESAQVVHIDEIGNLILKKDKMKLFAPTRQISDSYIDELKIRDQYPIGSKHDCVVQIVSYLDSLVRVSLRSSLVEVSGSVSSDHIKPGSVVQGRVVKMTSRGLLLSIGYRLNVFIKNIHLTDAINVAHPEKLFPLDKEVKCRILEIDRSHDPINILGTCKKTLIRLKEDQILDSIEKATSDFETTGVVVLSNKSGVLLEFFNGLRGFISHVLLVAHANIEESFKLGQLVKCRVISADSSNNRISLSLASQDRHDIEKLTEISRQVSKKTAASVNKKSLEDTREERPKRKRTDSSGSDSKSAKRTQESTSDRVDEAQKINSQPTTESVKPAKGKSASRVRQLIPQIKSTHTKDVQDEVKKIQSNLGKSFLEQINSLAKGELDELTGEAGSGDKSTKSAPKDQVTAIEPLSKLSRVEKSMMIQNTESAIRAKETILADLSKEPESEEELDRLVTTHPTSSFYWLKYMTFMVGQGDLEKTRAISEKALASIPSINDDERFNIWVAKINLEFHFGDDETLKEVSRRALMAMDSLKVYTHLAKMYSEAKRYDEAAKIYDTMLKKFKSNKDVWIDYGLFYYTSGKFEMARKLMQRSFDSLAKRDHLDVISKFAQLEFKFGEIEKGKNLYESLLANNPRRTDTWLLYLAMLVKYCLTSSQSNDSTKSDVIESIRSVFERAIEVIDNSKKVQPILVKYLQFEETYGSSSNVSRIKHKLNQENGQEEFFYDC